MAFLNKKTANYDVYSGKINNKPYTSDLIPDLSSTRSTYEEILSDDPKTEKDNILARLMARRLLEFCFTQRIGLFNTLKEKKILWKVFTT